MIFLHLRTLSITAWIFVVGVASAVAQDVVDQIETPAVSGSSIPEPTVVGLIGAVGVMLILRGRRRR